MSRIPSFDGLRGISILLILLLHGRLAGAENGYIGVDIFFVLSGYLITALLAKEHDDTQSISLIKFYQRRTLRLFPALVLMCVLFLAYSAVFLPDFSARLRETAQAFMYITNWSRALGLGDSKYLGHTWSLGIEEQFYLLWPILFIVLSQLPRGRTLAFFAALALAGAAALWRARLGIQGASAMRLYNGFDTRSDAIFIGCALALVPWRLTDWWPVGVAVLVATFILLPWDDQILLFGGYTVVAIAAAFVIGGAAQTDTAISRGLSFAPLVAIGRVSYGLYLFHFPIYVAVAQKFGWNPWYLNTVGLGLASLVAVLSFRYLERPSLDARDVVTRRASYLAFAGPACLFAGLIYIASY